MESIIRNIAGFLFHCRHEKGLSTKTLKAYSIDLNQFITFLEKSGTINKIEDIDKYFLRQYLESLSCWKPKTIKRKIACLKAMFNYLEFEDEIAINPFRKMRIRIKEPKVLPIVMDQQEVKKILKAAYQTKESVDDKESFAYYASVRDLAVLELLFATGIRVSELCQLKAVNINTQTGLVQVCGKGNKERIIQVFNKEAKSALTEYSLLFSESIESTGFFFINRLGNKLSDQSVRNMIRNYTKYALLTKHITPHTFRHTFATLLLEADVDIKYIQTFLGHSSITTTQIYTHVNKQKQRKILATKHPRSKFKIG